MAKKKAGFGFKTRGTKRPKGKFFVRPEKKADARRARRQTGRGGSGRKPKVR